MPVQAVEQQSFGPEDIEILSNVFEEAVRELRLVDRTDPATQLVAKRIIDGRFAINVVKSRSFDPILG